MEERSNPYDTAIRLLVIALLLITTFLILSPFILLLVWAIIIAVAVMPLYTKFEKLFGKRKKLSAVLFTFLMVHVLILPLWAVSGSLIEYVQILAESMKDGSFHIPPANDSVKSWPIIGDKVFSLWQQSSENLAGVVEHFQDQIITFSSYLLSAIGGFGMGMAQFLFSIIIAGVFIASRENLIERTKQLTIKLAGENGQHYIPMIGATIRSISQGVLGVAVIQGVLSYIGFALAGVPGAEFWAMAVAVVAIIQLPPLLIMIPVMIYEFSVATTMVAVSLSIYLVLVSLSDNILKPLLFGRGGEIPMLILLIGSIGGMLAFGIIGLFIGSVVLAIFYKIYQEWLKAS